MTNSNAPSANGAALAKSVAIDDNSRVVQIDT
jgi:hypothetical protein